MGDKIKFQEIITISIFFLSIQSSFEYFYTIFKYIRIDILYKYLYAFEICIFASQELEIDEKSRIRPPAVT